MTITTADHLYSIAQRLDWGIECGVLLAVMAAVGGCSAGDSPTPVAQGGDQGVGGNGTNAAATTSTSSATGGATPSNGGASNTGSTRATAGGSDAVGGTKAAGGSIAAGGTKAAGGSVAAGGTKAAGGSVAVGGTKAAGGAIAMGGSSSNADGGANLAGGSVAVGGTKAGGGSVAVGGTKAGGGSVAVGGTKAAGGSSAVAGAAATGGAGGSAEGAFVEFSGSSCNATSAGLLSAQNKKLPDPFAMHSGTRISAKSDWTCRRAEIKADIEKYEIGPKPDASTSTVKATLSGSDLSVAVTTSSGSITIKTAVSGSGSCVRIATDMALAYVTGCTNVTFSTADVIPYNNGSGSQSKSDPFYKVYPDLWGKIGNYTAWSWGVSRLIDGLDQVKDQLKIDMTKIATHGCSYAGKMALFAGAFDERVALTVAEESGGGGIDSWRASADFSSRTGTSVEKIDNTNFAWFMSSMKGLDPYKLPHDHHELIAMVAPRAIIILGNPGYEWLGDESGYKSTMASVEVFKALGVADHIGYDFTGNHAHCTAAASQQTSISAFADKFLHGKTTTSTDIAIKPVSSKFDLGADFDWTAPTLQ
jgi:hypothetical protein